MNVHLNDLRSALTREEVIPSFQPLVELRTGRLAGFEVLARWQHPVHGLILPENFISLAEENGLIGLLTEQILRKSFLAGRDLPKPIMFSVNIAPAQLHDFSLPGMIRDLGNETGFPTDRLVVEITESALIDNIDRAQKIASELKSLGCRLALDDFGKGYSSLAHLQALSFDELKVDRTFVESMTEKRQSRKIVAAVVGLGRSLGMTTVAEGVETEEQADLLLRLGCELGQGWLYGRPQPAERIAEVIAAAPRKLSACMAARANDSNSSLEAFPAQRLGQLQAIYNGAPVGLCFLDTKLRYVSVNQRLADMNGASIAAHIGRHVEEMIPDLYRLAEPYLMRALKGEAISDVEYPKRYNKMGEADLTVLVSYQPVFDEVQEVIGVSVAIVDVTYLKRAQKSLLEVEDNYRYMMDNKSLILWISDIDGNLTDIGAHWLELTGMNREQALNRGWMKALHPDDMEPATQAITESMRTGRPIDIRYRIKTAEGKWRWMRSHGSPRYRLTGDIIRWYGDIEDLDDATPQDETHIG